MRLLVVRHLATGWNKLKKLQGRRDEAVVVPSKVELDRIREALRAELGGSRPDEVLVSELRRTRETAMLLGFEEVTTEALLNELDFGAFEGQSLLDLEEKTGGLWTLNPEGLSLGEPVSRLGDRARAFLEKYEHHQLVVAFGHGAWMRALYSIIKDHGRLSQMNRVHIPNHSILSVNWTSEGAGNLKIVVPNGYE
jgi:broad specificity phosphatase PhoE